MTLEKHLLRYLTAQKAGKAGSVQLGIFQLNLKNAGKKLGLDFQLALELTQIVTMPKKVAVKPHQQMIWHMGLELWKLTHILKMKKRMTQ